MLKSGLRPTQQCRTIVRVKAATEKNEEAMSYDTSQHKHAHGFLIFWRLAKGKHTSTNVHGVCQ
jgi:hypothetical protein